ncbi:protein TILLER ANGLE CONTROL 1-like [Solanum dulcamara]|uniref:protein TILLER ANGLE CONTROL 1-like n=1 Tax=Solanum dulcamara TaxID=45834 RepID=UPI002485BB2F|nr:protein TILLER ANGLE CONTROL 1-like [Solanum dulcamara]
MISNDENIGDHKQLVLQDEYSMLDGWKGGILTIGTFGFDPLIKDELETGLDDVEDHEECEIIAVNDDEEQNPMMYANNGREKAPTMPNVIPSYCPLADNDEYSNKGIKKERITLADLFSTHLSDDKEKVQLPDLYDDVSNINNKKSSKLPQVKNGLSFAKKIIPRVREDSRRIQKLMTRALKKKVHPDMESKNQKNSRAIIAAAASTMLELSPITTSKSISLREILETTA